MNATASVQTDATEIITRHYNDAWKKRFVTDWQNRNGRWTKAKQHAYDIADAEARAIERIVNDLRAAGYTIEEK